MTSAGKSIFGTAAMSGVRRAEDIESAAMARCTTRKSVHQYPNDSTNPNPKTIPNHSTPMGLAPGELMCDQDCVHAPEANAFPAGLTGLVATAVSLCTRPSQPPTLFNP